MVGCTAPVFGEGAFADNLYVVTNGGLFMPVEGGVREALVVNLNLNIQENQ